MTRFSQIRVGALVVVAGLALAACDSRTPTHVALRNAQATLHAISPNGTAGPATKNRNDKYNEVLTSLRSVAGQGRNGESAAAYLLIAQAQYGLAQGPASEAAEQERAALNDGMSVRAALSQWLSANALADASAAYDPTKELADIDAQAKEKMELRLAEQQKQAAIDARVDDILKQAKAKTDTAAAKRQEVGQLKSKVPNQTATEGERTLKQAQSIGREADALDAEASNLEAAAAQIAPESAEIGLQIAKLGSQKDLLEASKAAVQKRAQSAAEHAKEARDAANAAAAELKKRLTALEARRDGDLMKAADEALAGFRAALEAANKAGPDAKSTSPVSVGSIQQAIGENYWARARGLSEYASLLETLAAGKPALPDAAQYREKAAKAREAAKEALNQATDAYEKALGSYKGGGASAERMESARNSLADIVLKTSNGAKDLHENAAPKDETPATATPSEGASAAATIDPASPQGAVQALVDAYKAGDVDAVTKRFALSDDDRALLKTLLGMRPAVKKLDAAFKAKFGKGLAESAGEMSPGMQMPNLDDSDELHGLDASKLTFKVEGDTATAENGPEGRPVKLVKKDGKWLIDAPSTGFDVAKVAPLAAILGPMAKAMEEVAGEVQAGKYPDGKAAFAAIQQKAMGGMKLPTPKGK